MNLNIKLSTESINKAIHKLMVIKEYFDDDTGELVEILTNEGAAQAQAAYGDYPVAAVPLLPIDNTGVIMVVGDMPAIGEFGAGNATLYPAEFFETSELDAEVFPGSYSLYEGTMDYYFFKHWKFGGKWYEEVRPHLGLYSAKMYLIEHSTEIAREVIRL